MTGYVVDHPILIQGKIRWIIYGKSAGVHFTFRSTWISSSMPINTNCIN